ncbi:MAG: hypothetical protein IKC36_00515 [Clostridia bacterium]|nr:hypothetical protein [Clostridia bacterium]
MKKIVAALCAIAIAISLLAFAEVGKTGKVEASSIKTTAIADNFNADALDTDKWSVSGGTEAQSYGGALQFYGGDFSSCVTWLGTGFADGLEIGLIDDYNLEFIVSRDAVSWIAVYVGLDSFDLNFTTIGEEPGVYGNALVMNGASLENYTKMGVVANKLDGTGPSKLNVPMANDGTRYAIKLACDVGEAIEDNRLDFYYCEVDEAKRVAGEAQDYVKVGTIDNVSLKGYFGFGSMSTGGMACISDIKVTDANGELIWKSKSDLKDNVIDHIFGSASADKSKEFRLWNSYAGQKINNYFSGPIGNVKVNGEGSIISNEEIEVDAALINAYDFSSSITVNEMGSGFEAVFGKTESAETAFTFVNENIEDTPFTFIKYGGKSYNLGADYSNASFKLMLKVKTTGVADVFVNGKYVLSVDGVTAINGKLGFRVKEGADIFVDDVNVQKFVLVDYETKSIAENFNALNSLGRPVVNTTTDWYTAGNAFILSGETLFVNADQSAFLATKQMYSDYVVKFTLSNIMQGAIAGVSQCSWIGISVGKQMLTDTYANCQTIIFAPRGVEGDKVGYNRIETIGLSAFDGGKTSLETDYNIFEDFGEGSTHTVLNVMVVVNNRTITLYYKYDDEPDSALTIPRAVISDVDTKGFFSICTNYYGNFSVKNISVTNLSTLEGSISDYKEVPDEYKNYGDTSILG